MKVSLKWLQTYFDEPLPSVEKVANTLTFHAFEIEEFSGDRIDVKVLPNRAADCLSHRGLAKELSAILDIPLKNDPLSDSLSEFLKTDDLTITIENSHKCMRFVGAVMKGVKVGPSPIWLKEALEAVGQRSINNVVDATNYVMLDIGKPLHAYDAGKLVKKNGIYHIAVRDAKDGEHITTLSGEEYTLTPATVCITDENANNVIGIGGIKGGNVAEVTTDTTDLIIESANFDGTSIRRAAQSLKLFTDASLRFQNRLPSELAAYGMRDVLALIKKVAGGEVVGVVDEYPNRSKHIDTVSVSLAKINHVLGSNFSSEDVTQVFRRLALPYMVVNDVFTVMPTFERTDIVIDADLVEEVGRIIGYDKVPAVELPALSSMPDQARYRGMERMKDQLVEQGYIEVSTQSFAKKGDVMLANPLDKNMPALRTNLEENLQKALTQAKYVAPLVLAPNQKPKLFEVGTVFPKEGEHIELRMTERVPAWGDAAGTVDNLSLAKLDKYGKDYVPKKHELGAYKPFSVYPFIIRDIALWVPAGTEVPIVEKIIIRDIDDKLLARLDQFDQFEKEGRVSYAFRLVFESSERTLTDEEINKVMDKVYSALRAVGYEVR